eukprot:COSAG04_NODE_333_length_16525_cov_32.050527_3_plen_246_part_00
MRIGRRQGSPRDTKKAQLLASAASLLVLGGVTVAVVVDAEERLRTEALWQAAQQAGLLPRDGDGDGAGEGVEEVDPYIVFAFAVAGLVLDCTTFAAFHVWGRSPQRSVGSPSRSSGSGAGKAGRDDLPDEDEEEGGSLGSANSSQLNMCSAFLHVLADCLRSATTLCEAILIGVYGFDSERTDAIASLVVSATILVGCAVAAVLWVRSAVRFCRADGRDGGAAAEPQAPKTPGSEIRMVRLDSYT